ncbi:MAG TPA: MATE family efflux transporter [Granulicella sp.]|nr:MATE family efflux transporter [Granulicella sp.]
MSAIRNEIKPMLALALPLVLAELGWMFMAVVDTIMVGHLPNPAITISAAALAQVIYNTLAFGIGGVLLGLDTYIAQSHGAGKLDDANRWLLHGLVLGALLTALLMAIVAAGPLALRHLPIQPVILTQAIGFLQALNTGTPALLLYLTLRRYLQAFNHVRLIAVALISANLINALGDWLLLFPHHLGPVHFGGYGVTGAAYSTSIARLYLAASLVAAIWHVNRKHHYGLHSVFANLPRHLELWRLKRLFLLGAPVGGQIFVEISIFAAVTALIGTLGPLPLAGHEIALNCASTTFMVPFAISAAAAVRVGQAIGRRSPEQAAAAGWTAIALGAGFMLTASAALVTLPHAIARAFTADPAVIAAAVPLLLVAAGFQFFDGLQITASGALRGVGNTHAGLIVQLIGYWVVGLPVGLLLGYHFKLGAVGLWLGLCTGLVIAGVALILTWRRAARSIAIHPVTP